MKTAHSFHKINLIFLSLVKKSLYISSYTTNTYTISIYVNCLSKLGLAPDTIFHASLFADGTIF